MKSEIIIIGGGAAGLMAAYGAAKTLVDNGSSAQVTVLEKMPRPGRSLWNRNLRIRLRKPPKSLSPMATVT